MQITEIRIHRNAFEGHIRAYVSITFDHVFVVHDIKVVEGDSGLFVVMPHRRMPNGERRDVAHPLTNDFRAQIQARIIEEFHRAPNGTSSDASG